MVLNENPEKKTGRGILCTLDGGRPYMCYAAIYDADGREAVISDCLAKRFMREKV
jgi:hypothetical protein